MKVISLLLFVTACASNRVEPDPIRDVFTAKYEKFRQCYLESETYTRKESARIKVLVVVHQGGSVKESKVLESTTKDPNFSACIEGQLKLLKFPAPAEGGTVEITQPFNFHTGVP